MLSYFCRIYVLIMRVSIAYYIQRKVSGVDSYEEVIRAFHPIPDRLPVENLNISPSFVSLTQMASVEVAKLSQAEKDELLCSYAALILHDEQAEMSADNINKLVKAAGAEVESYWPMLFSRALKNVSISDLLKAGAAPAAAPAAAGSASPSKKAAASPKAAAKKEEEEDAGDMGFSLFD